MNKILTLLLSAVVALSLTGCSPVEETPEPSTAEVVTAPYEPDQGTLLVLADSVLDGLEEVPLSGVSILIRHGRFVAIGPEGSVAQGAADLPVLDLRGMTVLPGLLDLHTHLMDVPDDTADLQRVYGRTEAQQLEIGRRNAAITLEAGFTTTRNVGAYHGFSARQLRDDIDRGEVPGPRMQIAGYYLTIPGGGGDLLIPGVAEEDIPPEVRMGVARGVDPFRERAEAAVAGGADVLKVIASGAVLAFGGIPGEPEMTPEEIEAVAQVAHAAGLRLAAHAHGARSIKEAILAGADTIEHASLIDEEGLLLARERGVSLAMDVYNGDYIDSEGRRQGWPEEFLRKNLETVEAQRQAFRRGVELGVDIVFATDSAVYPHGDNARQFAIMVEHGMSEWQAIEAATSKAATAIGWQDRVGAIAPGRLADLIAVRGNPLEDITTLEEVLVVVKGGELVVDKR